MIMNLGEKIKFERKNNNMSQQKLADYLNISRQAVSRWENNISLPDLNTIKQISNLFNLPVDYFIDNNLKSNKSESKKNGISEIVIKKATPYILILTAIITLVALLPNKAKVPILFFGTIGIIFFMTCLLIYFIILNYLSK